MGHSASQDDARHREHALAGVLHAERCQGAVFAQLEHPTRRAREVVGGAVARALQVAGEALGGLGVDRAQATHRIADDPHELASHRHEGILPLGDPPQRLELGDDPLHRGCVGRGRLRIEAQRTETNVKAKQYLQETTRYLRNLFVIFRDNKGIEYVDVPKLTLSKADHQYFIDTILFNQAITTLVITIS